MADKILVFQDNAKDLLKYPNLFSHGNVIQISPLPGLEHIQAFTKIALCKDCAKQSLTLISYEISNRISALFARCKECRAPNFAFFSEDKLSSPHILIIDASSKDNFYRNQLQGLPCDKCNLPFKINYLRNTKDYDIQRIIPMQAKCSSCQKNLNIIFWDSPRYYFDEALALADEVIPSSPRAGLAFLISALETFLQKAFLFQSSTNKFLVDRRKVSFQSLQEAKDIYLEFMKIDLSKFINSQQWAVLTNAIQARHGLIHNAGFDKNFEPIEVVRGDLSIVRDSIIELVNKLKEDLEIKGLI